ncbi:hydroxymethylpyrimidine kinase / phosphohydroxymethylpyrimidine kinase [Campylobacter iguaniorum]|uniref:bifunctional hydroxymethylpyrimidine kinase/phosphomethylpyrimidine kinase n=1 Tax=Campylobacter iguaniorum TaxID=1244531 RepID=UPI0007C9096A|nr:bifunctional hydroxymethylpyrimidine kinase/phosphomethylpyrimidine kinase [Campylobacter iguaniorum]ANE36006.1 hydroxymethylpyrimidine kinase / phosphohydroxymethylpyrimidine kinase [Campylobacter iguaniorum]
MQKILTIAGSDCSGGAGIQADIKTITAHKMYAMSVITALTAQNTMGVYGVRDVEAGFVAAQIEACFSDIIPDAVKIAMVSNEAIVRQIGINLKKFNAKNIVLDPVMVATSGGKLISDEAIKCVVSELFSLADIITPNLPEAEVLANMSIKSVEDMKKAALNLAQICKGAVLVKGGHLDTNAVDILYSNGEFSTFEAPRIETKNTHGTGCTLSSAIACGLGANLDIKTAVARAKEFVSNALKTDIKIGQGNGAIDHYFRINKIFD